MKQDMFKECNTLEEVQTATSEFLDSASLCPLKVDDNGVVKDVENFKGVYNNTKGNFVTAVCPHYKLIQHKEYFDGVAQTLSRLNIKYKMTLKASGNKAFADIEFQNRNIKYDKLDEEFTTGLRIVNSYDKSTGLHILPRFTRLACLNGMIVSRFSNVFSVKHHSKMLAELHSFIETKVNELINTNEDLQIWVSEGMKDSVEWKVAARIIEKLFQQPKHREEILKRLNISMITVEDKKSKKKSIKYISEDKEKKKITRWNMYNACTEYITHGEQITPHIENLFHMKVEVLLNTPLKQMPIAEIPKL